MENRRPEWRRSHASITSSAPSREGEVAITTFASPPTVERDRALDDAVRWRDIRSRTPSVRHQGGYVTASSTCSTAVRSSIAERLCGGHAARSASHPTAASEPVGGQAGPQHRHVRRRLAAHQHPGRGVQRVAACRYPRPKSAPPSTSPQGQRGDAPFHAARYWEQPAGALCEGGRLATQPGWRILVTIMCEDVKGPRQPPARSCSRSPASASSSLVKAISPRTSVYPKQYRATRGSRSDDGHQENLQGIQRSLRPPARRREERAAGDRGWLPIHHHRPAPLVSRAGGLPQAHEEGLTIAMYMILGIIKVKPEHLNDFVEHVQRHASHSIGEPGCVRFDVLQDEMIRRQSASTKCFAARLIWIITVSRTTTNTGWRSRETRTIRRHIRAGCWTTSIRGTATSVGKRTPAPPKRQVFTGPRAGNRGSPREDKLTPVRAGRLEAPASPRGKTTPARFLTMPAPLWGLPLRR